jgi:NAD(P)H-hydrate epimerase
MAEIDELAIEDYGMTESALMENAGQLTARHARRHFLGDSDTTIGILCGGGHNGADGMVMARWFHQWNYSVKVYLMQPHGDFKGLPKKQLRSLRFRDGIDTKVFSGDKLDSEPDLWVDALLGTGLSGDPRPPYDSAINTLNDQPCPVVSVDVPSGLNGDDNRPYDPCVQADLTVTYGLPKLGLLVEPGYAFAGLLIAQEIGFPPSLYEQFENDRHLISAPDMGSLLPGRYPISHKGSAGRLCVVAGSSEYTGAPFLVGNAAARVGSGLTSLVGPEELSSMPDRSERDLIFPYRLEELIKSHNNTDVEDFLEQQDAFVVGPGLGQSEQLRSGLLELIPTLDGPVVLDADGLNNLQGNLDVLTTVESAILTPHPGEASRLLDVSVQEIKNQPIESLTELVKRTQSTVILKSSRPLVGHPDGTISINVTGTAALAKGGSGDVLSGLIGGLLVQGLNPGPASCLGLYLHGASGRDASERLDTVSVRSEDIIQSIPAAIEELEGGQQPDWFPVKSESQYGGVLGWNPFRN